MKAIFPKAAAYSLCAADTTLLVPVSYALCRGKPRCRSVQAVFSNASEKHGGFQGYALLLISYIIVLFPILPHQF